HRVYVGETTKDVSSIGLPESVPVTLADNTTIDVAIENWQPVDDWDPNEEGVYTFEGEFAENAKVKNPLERSAIIYVYNRLTPPETNRDTEWLDRGVVALPSDEGIFISWRLLVDEYEKDITFNIYRDGKKLNDESLKATNFVDQNGSIDN